MPLGEVIEVWSPIDLCGRSSMPLQVKLRKQLAKVERCSQLARSQPFDLLVHHQLLLHASELQ
jgi:acyl-CoA hydrolase